MGDEDLTEQPTQKLTPFETAVLRQFDELNTRLDKLETAQSELGAQIADVKAKTYDTKPIWERALAEILEVKSELVKVNITLHGYGKRLQNVEGAIIGLATDLPPIRADLREFEERLSRLEKPGA